MLRELELRAAHLGPLRLLLRGEDREHLVACLFGSFIGVFNGHLKSIGSGGFEVSGLVVRSWFPTKVRNKSS